MKPRWLLFLVMVFGLAPPLWAGDGKNADKKPGDEPKKEAKPVLDPKNAGKNFQVPYRLTDTQHVLVRAKINGKGPFNFIIDTGAPMLFVSVPIAKKVGLEAGKDKFTTLDRFEMEGGVVQGKVKCRVETPFQLEGMNAMGLAGVELHGIIGYTVLAYYKMEFDFTRDKMTWTQLAFDPPQPKPVKIGKKEGAGMAGLESLGGIMKFISALTGLRPAPPPVPRGFLGLELAEADGALTVKSVLAMGPADKAGLKVGDKIQQVQGNEIKSFTDVVRHCAGATAGQTVRFSILRATDKHDITITAGEGL